MSSDLPFGIDEGADGWMRVWVGTQDDPACSEVWIRRNIDPDGSFREWSVWGGSIEDNRPTPYVTTSEQSELAELRKDKARLIVAMHDAINRPKGTVPDSALDYYDPKYYDAAMQQEDGDE